MYVRQDYIFRCEFWGSEIKSVLQNIKIPPTHNFLTGPVTYNELSNELTNLSAEYLFSFLKAIELRKKVIESKSDALDVVAEYLVPKFRFNPQTKNFNMYANYIEEMHKRVRK